MKSDISQQAIGIEAIKDDTITKIQQLELDQFLTVTADDVYSCQQSPDEFLCHRKVQLDAWDLETLISYLSDLEKAHAEGNNLMTIKYAYMDGQLILPDDVPMVAGIVEILFSWQHEMFMKYPALMRNARLLDVDSEASISFKTYLKAELCTYSEKTLECLFNHVVHLKQIGLNMSEIIYANLMKTKGYSSIEAYITHNA